MEHFVCCRKESELYFEWDGRLSNSLSRYAVWLIHRGEALGNQLEGDFNPLGEFLGEVEGTKCGQKCSDSGDI